ncbi:MAG: C25 family cysteine peptidase [Verrucomicrobiales bacterium]
MRRCLPLLLLALLSTSAPAKTWLAISPDPALGVSLEPVAELRRSQGFEVIISSDGVAEAIDKLPSPPDYVLILGDDQAIPARRGHQYRWLSTQNESFAADPLFSDLDGDGIPEFPVGRIPTNSPDKLGHVVEKILAYEDRELGIDDLNLPIWSGTPAYGKLLDESADWLLMSTINKYLPKWAQPWVITANPSNTLNAWPEEQFSLFNQQIQKGGVFTAMMGHGNTDIFLSMIGAATALGRRDIVYNNSHAGALDSIEHLSPPLVIFACDCGNFADRKRRSLASTLLLGRGGPVATIAATTESHPLTNFYSSIALMEAFGEGAYDRVGDLWLAAQGNASAMRKPLIERMLKNVEGALEVNIDIPKLKRDQMQMYAYLGDPALSITIPQELGATVERDEAGEGWKWSAEIPPGTGSLIVQHRPVSKPLRTKPAGADRPTSLSLFETRNGQFAFQTLEEIPRGEAWSGQISASGDLRLITISGPVIRVATHRLR